MTKPNQNNLFDFAEAKRRKEDGMAIAADNQADWLQIARDIAVELALQNPFRTCNADAVGEVLLERHGIASLGPAAGSLFKGGNWEFTGQRFLSKRKTNHARELKIWRLV